MTKLRLLRWSLILLILAALVDWLEPKRDGWGWLRGEAFYQGRPTRWWRIELSHWRLRGPLLGVTLPNDEIMCFARNHSASELWFDTCGIRAAHFRRSIAPPLL